jgi:AraC-like DNA-binding protein
MEYREYAPSPAVRGFVHCVWTLEGDAAELHGEAQPIVPDGRTELILHFGDRFERLHPDGRIERQPGLLFAGQLTSTLVLRPTGRISVAGIRLHPHGAAAFTRQPQREFVGVTVGLEDVSRELYRSLLEIRDSARSPEDAAGRVQHSLSRLAASSRLDARVSQVVESIQRSHGDVSIETLSRRIGLTRRHLERQFGELIGVSPKRLAKIVRLQRALQVLDASDGAAKGAVTAAACGYADQAHFIRECQDICGRAPGAHLLRRGELTGFFMD